MHCVLHFNILYEPDMQISNLFIFNQIGHIYVWKYLQEYVLMYIPPAKSFSELSFNI